MKHFALIVLFLFSTCCVLQAQGSGADKEPIFKPYPIIGMNVSQVSGDNFAGYRKFGCNCGLGLFARLPKNLSLGMEFLFNQKGSHSTRNQLFGARGERYKIIMDYVDVPFFLSYHDRDKAIFSLGVAYSVLVRHKEFLGDLEITPETEVLRRSGAEIIAGVTFLIKKSFGLNLRYSYSIGSVRRNDVDPYVDPNGQLNRTNSKWHNNVIAARLIYIFGNNWEEDGK